VNALFGIWRSIGPVWVTEKAWQVMELLKENHISWRMPSHDMFFISAFHLPHPDRRWSILVKRHDHKRVLAILDQEGLI